VLSDCNQRVTMKIMGGLAIVDSLKGHRLVVENVLSGKEVHLCSFMVGSRLP
jgi:hypothetical protein